MGWDEVRLIILGVGVGLIVIGYFVSKPQEEVPTCPMCKSSASIYKHPVMPALVCRACRVRVR